MILNVTELLICHNLDYRINQHLKYNPQSLGFQCSGALIIERYDEYGLPLDPNVPLWEQRHFGVLGTLNPFTNCHIRRNHLIHRNSHGCYRWPGRHFNDLTQKLIDPPIFLFWYGFCPLWLKKQRNKANGVRMPEIDRKRGTGNHYQDSDEVEKFYNWMYCYAYDLSTNPAINAEFTSLRLKEKTDNCMHGWVSHGF